MRMSGAIASSGKGPCDYQDAILQKVSRTFALTIPQLPESLRCVVTNAYLLCRIADTIEDESTLSGDIKQHFHERFLAVVSGTGDADAFAAELAPLLVGDALEAEVELVRHTPQVMAITCGFNAAQRDALQHCLAVMCHGMPHYERKATIAGLRDARALDRYCYYVAGVVGETLTMLFCDYSDAIAARRERMLQLGVSFGQGLQMVNILKDFWEDRRRGVCWLPRDLFEQAGISLADVDQQHRTPAFAQAYAHLLGIAHGHLLNGLEYTLLIPSAETGIRRFCLLALALAVQTLHCIHQRPDFTCGSQVKVTRRMVANTLVKTRLLATHDRALRQWFERMGRGLPIEYPSMDDARGDVRRAR